MDNALLAMGLKHKDERIAELEAQVKHLTTSGHDHTTQYWQTRCEELEEAIRAFLEAYDTAEFVPLKTIDDWADPIYELRKVMDDDSR